MPRIFARAGGGGGGLTPGSHIRVCLRILRRYFARCSGLVNSLNSAWSGSAVVRPVGEHGSNDGI